LCSGDSLFGSRPGFQFSCLKSSWLFSLSPGDCENS
jgi:hypothetical protein